MSKGKILIDPEMVDIVIVVGKDNPGQTWNQDAVKSFIQDCKNKGLTYKILGDGKTEANINEINSLPKTKNLIVWGHGSVNDSNEHEIGLLDGARNSQQIIKKIQVQTGAKNIVTLSCFGGQIVNNMKDLTDSTQWLDPGTNLFIPSPKDEISFIHKNIDVINMFIRQVEKDKKDKNTELNFLTFVQDVIETVPETSVMAHMPLGKDNILHPMKSCTMHMGDKVKENLYVETDNFTAYLIAHLNNFIKELIENGQASGLGNYQDQCIMDDNGLPQTNWKDVRMSRSAQLEYNTRHKNYHDWLLTALVLKNKELELEHIFKNRFPKDPVTWTKQASHFLKMKFCDVSSGNYKFGKEIQVLVDYGANIFDDFYNVKKHKNESIIDYVIQSKNFNLLEIMSKTNQQDNNGYSVLDHIIINSEPKITENITNMIELALNANLKMTLHSNNIHRLIDLANQNYPYGNYIWKAIKNNPSVLNNVLQKANSEQLTGLFLTAIKEDDRNLISFMLNKKKVDLDKAIEWKYNDVNLINILMKEYGAKPNAKTEHLTASSHTIGTAKLGNELYHTDDDHKHAELLTAIQKSDKAFIRNLIKQKNINPKDALDKAIEWKLDDVNLINTLMHDHGAKPDRKTIALAVQANPAYIYQTNRASILDSVLYYADDDEKILGLLEAIQRKDSRFANYLINQHNISPKNALDKVIEWKWGDVNLINTLMNIYGAKPDVKTMDLAFNAVQTNGAVILNSVVNCADNDHKIAALLHAIQKQDNEFAKYLINQYYISPKDALDKAIEWKRGDVNLINTLMNIYGAKPDVKTMDLAFNAVQTNGAVILNSVVNCADNDHKIAALLHAIQKQDNEFAKYLINQYYISPKDALDKAIEWKRGDVNLINTLMNIYGAKPDVKTMDLAFNAVQTNGPVILNSVVNCADNDHKIAALLHAIQRKDSRFANYLINQHNISPKNALDKAIEWKRGDVNLINTLMDTYGAKPDAQTMKLAVINSIGTFESVLPHVDDEEIVFALLDDLANDNDYAAYLIDKNLVDPKDALDKAIEWKFSNNLINKLMNTYGAKPDAQTMKLAMLSKETETFESVLPHVDDKEKVLALIVALIDDDNKYADYLIDKNLVDPKDALDKAIEWKFSNDLINKLMHKGAKPDAQTIYITEHTVHNNGEVILNSVLNYADNDQKIAALLDAMQKNGNEVANSLINKYKVNPKDALDKAIERNLDSNLITTLKEYKAGEPQSPSIVYKQRIEEYKKADESNVVNRKPRNY